jgi:hypothetical protein
MKYKILLYIVSLWILFLLLFINRVRIPVCLGPNCHFLGWSKLFSLNVLPTIFLGCILLCLVAYLKLDYRLVKGGYRNPWKVVHIENMNYETLTFLATYIIPLLFIDLDKDRNPYVLFLMLLVIGIIFIKTNVFYTNPTLSLLNFYIYRIDTISEQKIIVISKGKIAINDWIYHKRISDNIFLVKKGYDPTRTESQH